ncbi:MAG: UbiH/UbiF/VisC/COQ6 family ubiquinone biosynthesis hydroxylase [Ectothiorhodospiraceae bacterium]|jgi:2-octaprenylphenol hydroxylase
MTDTDVLVQGAGMVGLTLALGLARSGFRVTVLDARRPPVWHGGDYRLRVSAVNPASRRLLAGLGAWEGIARARISPFHRIEAVDVSGGGRVGFDAAELGEPCLGHIVENELIQAVLAERVREAGVDVMAPVRLADWQLGEEAVRARLEDGRRLDARLLVGADGADSAVREVAGIAVRETGYGQRGLVAAVSTERPHGETARQRFLPGGPLAFLPLADGRCSIVWSLPQEQALELLDEDEDSFAAVLEDASGGMLGAVTGVGERGAFPLRRLHAERYVADRVALVGDAAHVIHPLAGQGANLGFMDAAALTQILSDARSRNRDPGGRAVLRRFERARRGENLMMQAAMDGFHHAFTSESEPVVRLRSLGFQLADSIGPLKHLFMRRAMGTRP